MVVNQVSSSDASNMASIVNLLCQTLVEAPGKAGASELTLSIEAIENPSMRSRYDRSFREGAKRKTTLSLGAGKREKGDADNPLLEIRFSGPERKRQERQQAMLTEFFGVEDDVVFIQHDEALKQASERARARVVRVLKPRWRDGAPYGEQLLVKAPFKTTSGGNEWMWVEVIDWQANKVRGVLQNQPYDVPDLAPGARVVVDEADIFDYLWRKADGTVEGNETGEIIRRMQEGA